jgi:hypothetical protein
MRLLSLFIFVGLCGCNNFDNIGKNSKSANSNDIVSPSDTVRSLLHCIENKDWVTTCEYLSSEFLSKHKARVLAGSYFVQSHRQDKTCFYTSEAQIVSEVITGDIAIVKLQLGQSPGKALRYDVGLMKEKGVWKVNEF